MKLLMSRKKVLTYHTAGTICILVFLTLITHIWYPTPYGEGLGLWRNMLLLWFFPLGTGPLLTYVLFKPGKAGLWFDISFITVAQVATLLLSVWLIYQARPVFVVFAVDRFEVVQLGGVVSEGEVLSEFSTYSNAGPIFAVAEMPTDPKESTELLFSSLDGTGDVQNFARYYRPYKFPYLDQILERASPLSTLIKRNPNVRGVVIESLGSEEEIDQWLYLPVMMRDSVMTAIIDPKNGSVRDLIPVQPK